MGNELREKRNDRRWAAFNGFFGPASIALGMWYMVNGAEESPFFYAISPLQVWVGIAMVIDYFKYKMGEQNGEIKED